MASGAFYWYFLKEIFPILASGGFISIPVVFPYGNTSKFRPPADFISISLVFPIRGPENSPGAPKHRKIKKPQGFIRFSVISGAGFALQNIQISRKRTGL